MIQSVIYFALGFLSAVLLVLLVAPPIWRRAMLLTRKHVEAETPLTLNEIQAQRDGLRAEHAMAERKLELALESARNKAALHLTEIGEKERIIRKLTADLGERETSIAGLSTSLSTNEDTLERSSQNLSGTAKTLEERTTEVEQLHRRLSKLSIDADSLQIELAAQSARVENLLDELNDARREKRDSDEQRRKIETEHKALQHSLEQETAQRAEFEKQATVLLTKLSDAEAKLARREKDMERLNERLRKVLADGRKQGTSVVDTPRGKQALIQADETRLMRDEMNTLAAQVVAMVAKLEGETSPVNEILAKAKRQVPAVYDENGEAIVSIADRVRALQAASKPAKAAEPRESDA
ncbi:hypothetical protein [Phyllobacterium pellucidum]|uniref:hypothetical protein n=1 Tax=Phyllobacterium pellucidum TaxID=2740464 RepID=UPI001D15A8C8|nr:hypothetical protein [Phyllobacterium sp. T1018]UGY09482.1 hypothetical protein LLE51_015960 [Phyllobacterium sp. T1018]